MKFSIKAFYLIFINLLMVWQCHAEISLSDDIKTIKKVAEFKKFSSLTNPKEVGLVNWNRSLEKALQIASVQNKPVFLLFQEVPGCKGCRDFGAGPLNNMLIVEAIESLFVPVFIYNNKHGYDAKILKQYNEPDWNYPVIRFLNKEGADIIPRAKSRTSTTTNYLLGRMINALQAMNHTVPTYLKLLMEQSSLASQQVATFRMACYWQGERAFGDINGVVSTQSRWIKSPLLEVVDVTYLPEQVSYKQLMKHAMGQKCADKIYTHNEEQHRLAKDLYPDRVLPATKVSAATDPGWDEQKYYLKKSAIFRYLPLTEIQATRLNSQFKSQTTEFIATYPPVYRKRC